MEVNGTSGSSSVDFVARDQIGVAGMTSDDFLKLLITELQNQDPSEPMGNEQILSQLSMMRNLESDLELGDALKAITVNQQLTTAAAYIGRNVTGTDAGGNEISGHVQRAYMREGTAYLEVDGIQLNLSDVSSISEA
ncbi:MAG: flagellar hook capping protein [Planctomycetaceae bacterium]|nr:flagellar hook capping protein [Planctomycetaceae bacterium]